MKKSVYVDERPELGVHIERTKEWWSNERHFYDLYISDFVTEEIKNN